MSLSDDHAVEKVLSFPWEIFGTEEADDDPGSILFDEKGCILLPLKRPVLRGFRTQEKEKAPDPQSDEEVQERIAALEREAYEKGFVQGQKDGRALEERQLNEKAKSLDALLVGLSGLKEQIYRETEQEMVRLSVAIAKKITRNELQAGRYSIEETIRASMKFLVDTSHIRIRISPEDMEEVSKLVPKLAADAKAGRIQIIEDRAVQRGGCSLHAGFGCVNATIEDQMAVVENEIERVLSPQGKTP